MGAKTLPGYKHRVIYSYSTRHLPVKDKVRFYYGLKGRDGKSGIIKDYKVKQLGKTVLVVQPKFIGDVEEFLVFWKCKYHKYEVMMK